jgi:hypothetical protein
VKLVKDLRRDAFGARLTARFALAFALIGVFPGALIYTVSIQFMTRSIESWFNVRVDTALDAGLTLGRTAIDAQLAELDNRAKSLAPTLGQMPEVELPALLTRIREASGANEAMVMTSSGRPIAFVTAQFGQMLPAYPPLQVVNQLRLSRGYSGLETIDQGGITGKPSQLVLRVIVPIDVIDTPITGPLGATELRWLQLIKPARGARWLPRLSRVGLITAGLASIVWRDINFSFIVDCFCSHGCCIIFVKTIGSALTKIGFSNRSSECWRFSSLA